MKTTLSHKTLKVTIMIYIAVTLIGCEAGISDPTITSLNPAMVIPTETHTQTVTLTPTPEPSVMPTISPTPTFAPVLPATATKTRRSPKLKATATPISTPLPIFDPKSVVTHTPASPVSCPVEDPNFVVQITPEEFWNGNVSRLKVIQNELKQGASLRQVSRVVNKIYKEETGRDDVKYPLLDLNGDGVDELIFIQMLRLYAIGCIDGDYKTILDYFTNDGANGEAKIVSVKDMNLNGTPEIVIVYSVTSGSNLEADIIEWNGTEFVSLLRAYFGENAEFTNRYVRALYWYENPYWQDPLPVMNGWADVRILDLDQNGTKELILTDDGPAHRDTRISFGPWRGQQKVFSWNGLYFQYSGLELTPPEYRFQAVNDADRQFLLGNYERALELYQDVIFSDKLDFWSEERSNYAMFADKAEFYNDPTPTMSAPNPSEYANLSAYARYRILLHHLTQGWVQDASTIYETLQAKHPPRTEGYAYVEMAALLWDEYQKTGDLASACQPVIRFVEQHPEILDPLGNSDYHRGQAHNYIPQDVCPFGIE